MLMLVIQHHPHRPATDLWRKLVRCLARHGSTFSGVGASDKPGAVQECSFFGVARLITGGSALPVRPSLQDFSNFKVFGLSRSASSHVRSNNRSAFISWRNLPCPYRKRHPSWREGRDRVG